MRSIKCDTCRNRRPVMSENGLHYTCALPGKKPLYCMAYGRYYEHLITADEIADKIAESKAFQDALARAIEKEIRRQQDA